MSNEIAITVDERANRLAMYALQEATSQALTPKIMVPAVLNCFRKVRGLADCSNASLISALSACASLGLAPGTPHGHAYLIPFKGEATVIIGYKGFMELARRAAMVKTIHADVVIDGEPFDLTSGTGGLRVEHKPDPRRALSGITRENAAERLVGAYCVLETRDGSHYAMWVSGADIEAARKRGASGKGKSTPWDTDYAAMARKTAVRAMFASGEAPMSDEIARAIEVDDAAVADVVESITQPQRPALPGGAAVKREPAPMEGEIVSEAPAGCPPKLRDRLASLGWLADAEAHVQCDHPSWDAAMVQAVTAWATERKAREADASTIPSSDAAGGEE